MTLMSDKEWLTKAIHKGGVYDALEYGLSHKQLDPATSEIYDTVYAVYVCWEHNLANQERLEDLMETLYDED